MATINTPSISQPSNNSEINNFEGTDGLELNLSTFASTGDGIIHTGTHVQVSTSSDFSSIVLDYAIASTSNTVYLTGLSRGNSYYVRVKYMSESLSSEWSDPVMFNVLSWTPDASGRTFIRHSSGMGTVMRWVDKTGNTHNTLVLDAQYRTNLKWGGYGTDIPTMTNYQNSPYYLSSGASDRTSTDATDCKAATAANFFANNYTDSIINNLASYFEDASSSKLETDRIIAALGSATSNAAGYCRSQSVNGTPCDLPNIQTLIRIYCSMFTLDEMDASTSNNTYRFTMAKSGNSYNWTFGSKGKAWSSTEHSSTGARYLNNNGYVWGTSTKDSPYGVIPVLEV